MINLLAALSSFTLFFTEFAAAQALLPLFGGSAMVWGVSLVFYNVLLLTGYLFSHLTSKLSFKTALSLSGLVYCLFPWLSEFNFEPSATSNLASINLMFFDEHIRIIQLLFRAIGPSFFILSCTSPLFQSVAERSSQKSAYHIYSWSNAGGFAALIAYPFILRPFIDISFHFSIIKYLSILTGLWGGLYLIYCLVNHCLINYSRVNHTLVTEQDTIKTSPESSNSIQPIFKWLLNSTTVNALLLAITNFLTMDMPSLPLFWVLPLGIFLLNFAIIWNQTEQNTQIAPNTQITINPIFYIGMILILFTLLGTGYLCSPILTRLFALILFYRVSKLLLLDLYNSRPIHEISNISSTLFYSLIATGGALGTFLVSFICPLLFNSMAELPLALALAIWAFSYQSNLNIQSQSIPKINRIDSKSSFILLFYISFLGLLIHSGIEPLIDTSGNTAYLLSAMLIFLGVFFFYFKRCSRLAAILTIILFLLKIPSVMSFLEPSLKMQHRNFYGIHRVFEKSGKRLLQHGMITHGRQYTDPAKSLIPLSYYNRATPLGEAFSLLNNKQRTALIGLGTGALSMYQKIGESWDILELDPFVIKTAKKWFTYLQNSTGKKCFIPGDARITLAQEKGTTYNVIVLDAFSGDMVPSHLLTLEAFKIYKKRLVKGGILILHISNLYFDLSGPTAAAGNFLGFKCFYKSTLLTETDDADPCTAMVLVREPELKMDYCEKLESIGFRVIRNNETNLWTDSRINLFRALQSVK